MAENRRCPECSAELSMESPAGLCPKCLLAAGLSNAPVVGEAPTDLLPEKPSRGFLPPTLEELAPLFPQLELLQLLGRGGMGAVYKARQRGLDRLVALKILPAEVEQVSGFSERFAREARALAHLSHPNIVTVYDFGQASGLFYFVMEFVDGLNLRQVIETGGPDPKSALVIVPQICEALQYAHEEGVVHRDIKPENVLLDKRGRVKIADFGLAKLLRQDELDTSLTKTHQVMGTPRYMAPEQMEGSHAVDHRADIYSLGVVFYELLTGELPLGRFAPPSKKVQIDVRLDEVVLRALEKEPEQRYQQASDVKSEVEAIQSSACDARPVYSESPPSTVAKSSHWPLVLGFVLLSALILPAAFPNQPLIRWYEQDMAVKAIDVSDAAGFKGSIQLEPLHHELTPYVFVGGWIILTVAIVALVTLLFLRGIPRWEMARIASLALAGFCTVLVTMIYWIWPGPARTEYSRSELQAIADAGGNTASAYRWRLETNDRGLMDGIKGLKLPANVGPQTIVVSRRTSNGLMKTLILGIALIGSALLAWRSIYFQHASLTAGTTDHESPQRMIARPRLSAIPSIKSLPSISRADWANGSALLVFVSVGLYVFSFFLPAGYMQSDSPTTHVSGTSMSGWGAFTHSARFGYVAWLANPALWVAWVLLILKRPGPAAVAGLTAMAFAASIMTSDALRLQSGYFLWTSSVAVSALGALYQAMQDFLKHYTPAPARELSPRQVALDRTIEFWWRRQLRIVQQTIYGVLIITYVLGFLMFISYHGESTVEGFKSTVGVPTPWLVFESGSKGGGVNILLLSWAYVPLALAWLALGLWRKFERFDNRQTSMLGHYALWLVVLAGVVTTAVNNARESDRVRKINSSHTNPSVSPRPDAKSSSENQPVPIELIAYMER